MKKIQIIGNVVRDAEVRAFEGGRSVINFDVAVNERFKDKNGQKQERTSYIRCSMWKDSQLTNIAQYITKGTKVYVEGAPEAEAYISKEGKAIGGLKINVREFELLGSAKKSEEESANPSLPAEDVLTPSANDDLPF